MKAVLLSVKPKWCEMFASWEEWSGLCHRITRASQSFCYVESE